VLDFRLLYASPAIKSLFPIPQDMGRPLGFFCLSSRYCVCALTVKERPNWGDPTSLEKGWENSIIKFHSAKKSGLFQEGISKPRSVQEERTHTPS
jgi:hypothetical protein